MIDVFQRARSGAVQGNHFKMAPIPSSHDMIVLSIGTPLLTPRTASGVREGSWTLIPRGLS